MSGPAILKFRLGARICMTKLLTIFVNWLNDEDTADVEKPKDLKQEHAKNQFLRNQSPTAVSSRIYLPKF
jgi:hypothetical protein